MTVKRVFVTGGGGFVGRRLLRELLQDAKVTLHALDRSGGIAADQGLRGVHVVRGDLLTPESYESVLRDCDVVLHLAAATGKANAEKHFRETATGTDVLLQAARRAGVPKILFVSSIAAAFPDRRGYPYAEAKAKAEAAIADSGLRYAIIRPTMILGEGSPILASLSALALPPVIVVPGTGQVKVQPIAVGDVVRAIVLVLNGDRFGNETFEIGGAEILTIEEMLQRIRVARTGLRGRVVRVPLRVIQAPLHVAERLGLTRLLPATAGQFSSFKHDGVVTANALQATLAPELVPLRTLLPSSRATATAPTNELDRECHVFTAYLVGERPDTVVRDSYRRAAAVVPALAASSPWERSLMALARRGSIGVRCADAYAALFARSSVLRKRLVMLLAILETRSPYSDMIDSTPGESTPIAAIIAVLHVLRFILAMVVGTLLLVPVRMLHSARGRMGS